ALRLLESIIRQEVQRGVLDVNHSVMPGHIAEIRCRDGGFLSRARVREEPMQLVTSYEKVSNPIGSCDCVAQCSLIDDAFPTLHRLKSLLSSLQATTLFRMRHYGVERDECLEVCGNCCFKFQTLAGNKLAKVGACIIVCSLIVAQESVGVPIEIKPVE